VSLLPECPCCGGLMTLSKQSTLSSACRCGFPDEVTWDDFPKSPEAEQLTETVSDPLLKRRAA
jgi:hypothetical protein